MNIDGGEECLVLKEMFRCFKSAIKLRPEGDKSLFGFRDSNVKYNI